MMQKIRGHKLPSYFYLPVIPAHRAELCAVFRSFYNFFTRGGNKTALVVVNILIEYNAKYK